jgi:Na+-transporting NADH:ubiquinone oxidoreductase subunit A
MFAHYRLRRGLDIPLKGEADRLTVPVEPSAEYAIKPTDFKHITPKLLCKENDRVLIGTPLFSDKNRPNLLFTSPVSGRVSAIVRGDKRRLLEIRILPDNTDTAVTFPTAAPEELPREQIVDLLLQSGLWPYIIQRPYGLIARPEDTPKALFISCFNSAPLAPDYDFVFADRQEQLEMGLRVIERLCPGNIHLGLSHNTSAHSVFKRLKAHIHIFRGPHPAGNVGVQIHHVCPVGKGQVVWTLSPMGLAAIGHLFLTGMYDNSRMVALTGSACLRPQYVLCRQGLQLSALQEYAAPREEEVRYVSGDPLTGDNAGPSGFLGFYHQQVTFLPEGNTRELFGWARPLRFKKFSAARTYLSYLSTRFGKTFRFDLNTNTNGGVRAFVMTGEYRKVLPMDIFVSFLLKAILAGDIDKMEALGIYEVIPEDLALCEFVCSSKVEIQQILQDGIDLMIKEMQ